mmetsp:Transcript_24527/g.38038  ORF Transcript_24527/g.38038 Transcript_24527/m.38038 type:complete len:277 (-) Transcript_24527:166-996(-)|eukprot:CAMPEP_0170486886 /NCGR_PEP_ID=MMETSP0208-20121228/5802_1 /TAXON_ID=197538 /ORGANISM="Strombidium inclinatum, Strain S3" /LENGTH=276 /DNA_ID=CAMNT_0010760971 /DNA_START=28 /DNA_END=858 /DNA_ORIENTATION=-
MKFTALALLGAVSAADSLPKHLQVLPQWAVNPTCKTEIVEDAKDVGQDLRNMPHDAKHQKATLATVKYFKTWDSLCHDTSNGFSCPNSAKDDIKAAATDMVKAIDACHSTQAKELKKDLIEFHKDLARCSHKVNADLKVLIKVELPPAGQAKLKKEWLDVEFEMRRFNQSPYSSQIKKDFEAWGKSTEAHEWGKTVDNYAKSEDGKKLSQELDEAFKELDNDTTELPNGFEIDNDKLDDIEAEFKDVEAELDKLETSAWGQKLKAASKKAVEQSDF